MMQKDKQIHLFGSFIVCYLLSIILITWQAAVITLALGAAKELVYDKMMGRGTPEWLDFAADCAGVALAIMVRGMM